MHIQNLQELPDVAERSKWSKAIGLHPSTFQRAERAGKLKNSKPGGRVAIYKKRDVLRWLQLDES
jgi:hypothetical protein